MATLQITSDELRAIRNDAKQEALMIAQGEFPDQSINQPGESGPYQDKTTYKKPKTEGQKLEESGDYIDTGEGTDSAGNPLMIKGGMPPEINPDAWDPRQERRKQRIRDLKQGNQNPNEKKAAERKQSPRERIDIPDFLQNVDVKPQDLLKILQLIPALTGFDLQMANAESLPQEQLMANVSPEALDALRRGTKKGLSSREIRDILKPYTQNDQFGNPSGSMRI